MKLAYLYSQLFATFPLRRVLEEPASSDNAAAETGENHPYYLNVETGRAELDVFDVLPIYLKIPFRNSIGQAVHKAAHITKARI